MKRSLSKPGCMLFYRWVLAGTALVVLTGLCSSCCLPAADVPTVSYPTRQAPHPGGVAGASVLAGLDEGSADQVTLSLSEATARALAYNEQVQQARAEVEKSKGRIVEARATGLPKLDFVGRYKRVRELPTIMGSKENYTLEVDLNQPLYLGGKIGGAVKVARLYGQYASEAYQGVRQAVIAQVAKAYYQVLLHQEFVLTAEQSLELSQKNLEDVNRQVRAGVASQFDRLRAQVQVSNLQAELIRAKNALHLAQVELLRTVGLSQDTKLRLTGKLSYAPAGADLAGSLEQAFTLRSELTQAELTIRMQKENVKLTKADLKPSLWLLGTYDWTKPYQVNPAEKGWDDQLSGQLMLSLPLFDGFRTKGKVVQEEATLRQYQFQLSALRKQVEQEVRQALLSLQDSRELIESQQENVKQAEESLRLAQVGYKQGINKQIDVLDAQVALTVARRNYASAFHAHMLAKLKLRQATGTLTETGLDQAPAQQVEENG